MTAIEQAQALQQQAIAILLAEREQIDAHLAQLGNGKETLGKKRGRPVKTVSEMINKENQSNSIQAP